MFVCTKCKFETASRKEIRKHIMKNHELRKLTGLETKHIINEYYSEK